MGKTSDRFGAEEYRRGALARLQEALVLIDKQHYAGSVYLGGRGVEAMLRAIIWKRDPEIQQGRKTLETGHDLREILTYVRNLGLLSRHEGTTAFESQIQRIGRGSGSTT